MSLSLMSSLGSTVTVSHFTERCSFVSRNMANAPITFCAQYIAQAQPPELSMGTQNAAWLAHVEGFAEVLLRKYIYLTYLEVLSWT